MEESNDKDTLRLAAKIEMIDSEGSNKILIV